MLQLHVTQHLLICLVIKKTNKTRWAVFFTEKELGRVALSRRFALDSVCDENAQQAVSFEATLIKGCRASGRHDEKV